MNKLIALLVLIGGSLLLRSFMHSNFGMGVSAGFVLLLAAILLVIEVRKI